MNKVDDVFVKICWVLLGTIGGFSALAIIHYFYINPATCPICGSGLEYGVDSCGECGVALDWK